MAGLHADRTCVLGISLQKICDLRLTSRASLIAASVVLQAAVIGLGWVGTTHLADSHASVTQYERAVESNHRTVREVMRRLRDAFATAPSEAPEDVDRLQQIVESTPTAAGASLIILDEQCNLIAHPALYRNANLRRVNFANEYVDLLPGGEHVTLGEINPRSTLTARAEFLAGPALLTISYDPRLLVKVMVMQPEADVVAAGASAAAGMRLWGTLITLGVLSLTGLGSWLLVKRYDTMLMRSNERLEQEVAQRTDRAMAIRNGLIVGLAKLADTRDNDTGRHLERICRSSELLARAMAPVRPDVITPAWIERLKLAASMHDIGKVGIPDTILHKPGALTPAEREIMQGHADLGADTLEAVRGHVGDDDLLQMATRVAREHHERYDGGGYPRGLKGEEIDLSARIVALADVYDALTSKRVYKPAFSHEEAKRIIVEGCGTQFDPGVVRAFLEVEGEISGRDRGTEGQRDEVVAGLGLAA